MSTEPAPTPYHSERYNPQEIEPKWQQIWADLKLYETDLESDKEPFYYLTMYPYPSGDLHVGHWYAFAVPDAYARFKRMHGLNVFFPMGFDAFGLPAENAAIKAAREGKNVHPATLTYERIARMEAQFRQMGTSLDWSKKIVTCDPDYYRWNQWFFLKMYQRGLAYRKESLVNWDPVDQTVLANEQVINGRGDRSGALIERRSMAQWHFKIIDYADELLDFSGLDWPEKVKLMQTNWIGRSEGAEVTFRSEAGDFTIFTTRPDTLWGVTFMVLAPEHPLVEKLTTPEQQEVITDYVKAASHLSELERQSESKEKTGVFTGSYAVNPVNGASVPVWVADYVMMGYGTGAIMAVPYGDQRDFEFARKFGLDIIPVVKPGASAAYEPETMTEAYAGPGTMINSGPINGTVHNGEKGRKSPAIAAALEVLEASGSGRSTVTYRLRDWLISRQRAWGTPIPFLYCDDCGLVPEKEANLPVVLPTDVAFMPTGESPLKYHEAFLNATCPNCGGPAKRETDTMDTFVDSSWYWFRFLSPHKEDSPFDTELAAKWTPAQQYTGGIEHAILHLLYARFFTKVVRDLGLIKEREPFTKLRDQGMILGEDDEKMSKSRGNVMNPDDLVAEYGADTVRAYLMFIGPWEAGGPWSSTGIEGVARFLNRVWALLTEAPKEGGKAGRDRAKRAAPRGALRGQRGLGRFGGVAVQHRDCRLMTLTNAMGKAKSAGMVATNGWQEGVQKLLLLLAPITPHIADELWERRGFTGSVHQQPWPEYDAAALEQDTITVAVQVSGKRRGEVTVPKNADKDAVLSAAKIEPNVLRHLEGKEIVREIVVPGRLVNIVVKG